MQMLLAQDCYGWGHKSVEILLEKIVNSKDPRIDARDRSADARDEGERRGVREELGEVAGKDNFPGPLSLRERVIG